MCSITTPSPIFSTGNKLTLHSWTEGFNSYQSYDIIYTTTDAGMIHVGRDKSLWLSSLLPLPLRIRLMHATRCGEITMRWFTRLQRHEIRVREMLRFIFAREDPIIRCRFACIKTCIYIVSFKNEIAQVEVAAVAYSITAVNSPRRCIPMYIATIPYVLGM